MRGSGHPRLPVDEPLLPTNYYMLVPDGSERPGPGFPFTRGSPECVLGGEEAKPFPLGKMYQVQLLCCILFISSAISEMKWLKSEEKRKGKVSFHPCLGPPGALLPFTPPLFRFRYTVCTCIAHIVSGQCRDPPSPPPSYPEARGQTCMDPKIMIWMLMSRIWIQDHKRS